MKAIEQYFPVHSAALGLIFYRIKYGISAVIAVQLLIANSPVKITLLGVESDRNFE